MLIQSMTYSHFDESGSYIGEFSLSPLGGQIKMDDLTERDLPPLVGKCLRDAFGELVLSNVYESSKKYTVFTIKYKWAQGDIRTFKFMAHPENYREVFKLEIKNAKL